jgi:disulfide bond formation protein DsbB
MESEYMTHKLGTPGQSIRLSLGVLVVAVIGWVVLGVLMAQAQMRFTRPPVEAAAAPLGPPGPELDWDYYSEGQTLFAATCVACHGPDGKGLPNLGKDLTKSKFVASLDDDKLVAFIRRGRDPGDPANTTKILMPPKGGNPALNDDQLTSIVEFVRGLQDSRRIPKGPPPAEKK